MKKKIIFVLFGLLCLFGSVFADTSFKFKLTGDGTGLCIDEYTGTDTVVFIQAYYNGMPVKEIGSRAFYSSNVTMVNLPDTVEKIGADAFGYCRNLQSINFPSNLQFIEKGAFNGCESLSMIIFNGSNKIRWNNSYNTFYGCISLSMYYQLELIKMGYPGSF